MKKSSNSKLFQTIANAILNEYEEEREPALISNFLIERNFIEGDTMVFDSEVQDSALNAYATSMNRTMKFQHSMILIGGHRDKEGKVWFLLQNFWEGKYFRLVSAEYLASCEGQITFIPKNIDVSLSKDYEVVDAHFVETCINAEECEEPILEEWADFGFEMDTIAASLL